MSLTYSVDLKDTTSFLTFDPKELKLISDGIPIVTENSMMTQTITVIATTIDGVQSSVNVTLNYGDEVPIPRPSAAPFVKPVFKDLPLTKNRIKSIV